MVIQTSTKTTQIMGSTILDQLPPHACHSSNVTAYLFVFLIGKKTLKDLRGERGRAKCIEFVPRLFSTVIEEKKRET